MWWIEHWITGDESVIEKVTTEVVKNNRQSDKRNHNLMFPLWNRCEIKI